jgi:hemerythrin-like domain-containing protein
MQTFPELAHHPSEGLIFRSLEARDDTYAAYTETLQQEHTLLIEQNRKLFNTIGESKSGEITPVSQLLDRAMQYVDIQIRHMCIEEGTVFPMIDQKLTISDRKKIIGESESLYRANKISRRSNFNHLNRAYTQIPDIQESNQV